MPLLCLKKWKPSFRSRSLSWLAVFSGNLPLRLPRQTNRLQNAVVLHLATLRPADDQLGRAGHQLVEMIFNDVFLQFTARREHLRLGVEQALVFGYEAPRLDPRLDCFRIFHRLDARLELFKR